MLVLSRRVGETVMIGNDVKVTILSVDHKQVRFGINTPKDVPVHREEVAIRIKKEREAANAGT